MANRFIYDASGGVVSTVEDAQDKRDVIWGQHTDHQAILDDNSRMRSLNNLGGTGASSGFGGVAKYHPTMISQWLHDDGITRMQFVTWPSFEQTAYIMRKLKDPDYRKLLRVDVKELDA